MFYRKMRRKTNSGALLSQTTSGSAFASGADVDKSALAGGRGTSSSASTTDVDGASDVFSNPFSRSVVSAASGLGSTEAGAAAGGAPCRLNPVLLNVRTGKCEKQIIKSQ